MTPPTGSNPVFDANNPAASGYELVLDSEFNEFNDFDLSCQANAPADSSCNAIPQT
jgi:hypothetical protein